MSSGGHSHKSAKRIAKNTLLLYFRQILLMLVSLYMVRVVLEVLGAEDYGLYNVAASIVLMISMLNGAMSSASQRYLSFELGKGNFERLKTVFSVLKGSFWIIAGIIFLLSETIGLWFVHTKLSIPPDRVIAARAVYHISVVSFIASVLTTPYMTAIFAHEKMSIYAYLSILEALLKLGVAFCLQLFPFDPLITYSALLLGVTLINTFAYRTIAKKSFEECRSKWSWDTPLFKEVLSFSGWNLFGSAVGTFRFHGVNIVMNQFFSPVVIAARSIASQVNTAVSHFVQNFTMAVRPQIIKSYAANDLEGMISLVDQSSKLSYALMYIFALPLLLTIDLILPIWLKEVPEYTVLFVQLSLIAVLIDTVSYPLMTVAQATGKIKLYQSVVGGVLLLNLPLSYFVLRAGYPPETVFYLSIALNVTCLALRLAILKRLLPFSVRRFTRAVLGRITFFSLLSAALPVYLSTILSGTLARFVVIVSVSILTTGLCGYTLLLNSNERCFIRRKGSEQLQKWGIVRHA